MPRICGMGSGGMAGRGRKRLAINLTSEPWAPEWTRRDFHAHHRGAMKGPTQGIIELIESRFPALSPRLRSAARFVLDNPEEIALHSMRAAAAKAGIHPSSMQRLARELGFAGYEG